MGQIVVIYDVLQDAPPPLKACIDKFAMPWDIIDSIIAITGVKLFRLAAV
jgi:hypothetical protein